jgi:hypothetical protein
MSHLSFSSLSRNKRPKSRVHRFLSEMDQAIYVGEDDLCCWFYLSFFIYLEEKRFSLDC